MRTSFDVTARSPPAPPLDSPDLRPSRTAVACLVALALTLLALPPATHAQSIEELCADHQRGVVNCGPGNNRRSTGGGEKVPHNDGAGRLWPAVSGILWQVLDGQGRRKSGGPLNDELLGQHGSDVLRGNGGHDIVWGDWDPEGNTPRQRDVLYGGPGDDWLYPSHGRSTVYGGPGVDYVWA